MNQYIVYFLLGSNMGDRLNSIRQACVMLEERQIRINRRSAIYESEPWGFQTDVPFYNIAVEGYTEYEPLQLLTESQFIEQSIGRTHTKNGYQSRIIDIDILFYEHWVLNHDQLVIPHPSIQERNFALIPLIELIPDFMHPVFHKTISQLLVECQDHGWVKKLSDYTLLP
jgi:2-amino-4-hydroxy-6-hydroxymethyldihydropteridine diphosphokinase